MEKARSAAGCAPSLGTISHCQLLPQLLPRVLVLEGFEPSLMPSMQNGQLNSKSQRSADGLDEPRDERHPNRIDALHHENQTGLEKNKKNFNAELLLSSTRLFSLHMFLVALTFFLSLVKYGVKNPCQRYKKKCYLNRLHFCKMF